MEGSSFLGSAEGEGLVGFSLQKPWGLWGCFDSCANLSFAQFVQDLNFCLIPCLEKAFLRGSCTVETSAAVRVANGLVIFWGKSRLGIRSRSQ